MPYDIDQLDARLARQDDWYTMFATHESRTRLGQVLRRAATDDPARISRRLDGSDGLPHDRELTFLWMEERLLTGDVRLGVRPAVEFDRQRQDVSMVVIHHTSRAPETPISFLEAMSLVRLYVPVWLEPEPWERALIGTKISSGHYRHGRQTFLGYTWMVHANGTSVQLLGDDEIGWQAGNWDVNCRSVGLVFNADLDAESARPTAAALREAARLISHAYPEVAARPPTGVLGHCQVRDGRDCPGPGFAAWRKDLVAEVRRTSGCPG